MDRELSPAHRRARIARRVAPALAGVAVVAVSLAALPHVLAPSVDAESVRLARVERGDVTSVVEASGVVEPQAERVVTSPLDARLLRVLRRAGDVVAAGDPLVELDVAAARVELGRLGDRVETLRLDVSQEQLAQDRALQDARSRLRSRELETSVAQARLQRAQRLHADGLVSAELLDERRLEVERAEIDVAGLRLSVAAQESSGGLRRRALQLQLQQAEREWAEQERQLGLAAARAEEPGVVTWVLDEPGRAVARGDVLARVASVESLRVRASVSDTQAQRVRPGMPVRVRTASFEIAGRVEAVDPAVEAGRVGFDVALLQRHEGLRPSLRVDAWVVGEARRGVLRLPAGAAIRGARGTVFVVRDGVARPREAAFGLGGPDAVEVTDGLVEGETVIVSDMADYRGADKVRIR